MGYTTSFVGKIKFNKPLLPLHFAYLMRFSKTRRMKRDARKTEKLSDPLRQAVGLPVGDSGGYYVGDPEYSNGGSKDVVDHNSPPVDQPGLWCQWVPTEDGTALEWDGVEKFYHYVEWLQYLIKHFYEPWGYVLNGEIEWEGEDDKDYGVIRVNNNVVTRNPGEKLPSVNNVKFNLRAELYNLLVQQAQAEEADLCIAFRDMLTGMMHMARVHEIDFDERLQAACEVFEEEDFGEE